MAYFFFNDPATTDTYTLSLHDALPICLTLEATFIRASTRSTGLRYFMPTPASSMRELHTAECGPRSASSSTFPFRTDRKSTRLNSSHQIISYAVFCLKKNNRFDLHMIK